MASSGVPARLHRELIGAADRWLLVTHGIYGSGGNWRSIARAVVEQRPDFGVVLVDLRQHGRSEPGEPPHDLAACAADLRAVLDEQAGIVAIAGHSFGGKVVLATRPLAPPSLRQVWMFDASPSARPGADADPSNTVTRVLAVMERLPRIWPKRGDFVAAIVADGHPPSLAQWLAMNLVARPDGQFALRLDLVALRAMVADYYARDLWDIALDPNLRSELHVVIAERSGAVDASDRARLGSRPPHIHLHYIDSGHWLHIDAPAEVVKLIVSNLPTSLP